MIVVCALLCALLCALPPVAGRRPLPPWQFTKPRGGFPGIAWFGANVSGFENQQQLETLGNYSMVVFGWQAWLTGSNYIGELDLIVEQAQRVKVLHPASATIVYIDGLRVQPFYSALRGCVYWCLARGLDQERRTAGAKLAECSIAHVWVGSSVLVTLGRAMPLAISYTLCLRLGMQR